MCLFVSYWKNYEYLNEQIMQRTEIVMVFNTKNETELQYGVLHSLSVTEH